MMTCTDEGRSCWRGRNNVKRPGLKPKLYEPYPRLKPGAPTDARTSAQQKGTGLLLVRRKLRNWDITNAGINKASDLKTLVNENNPTHDFPAAAAFCAWARSATSLGRVGRSFSPSFLRASASVEESSSWRRTSLCVVSVFIFLPSILLCT